MLSFILGLLKHIKFKGIKKMFFALAFRSETEGGYGGGKGRRLDIREAAGLCSEINSALNHRSTKKWPCATEARVRMRFGDGDS